MRCYYLLCIFVLVLPSCKEVEPKKPSLYEPELIDTQDPRIQQITVKNNTIFKLTIPRSDDCHHKIFSMSDYKKNYLEFIKHESSSDSDSFIFKALKSGELQIMFDRICPEWEGKPRNEWPTDISKKAIDIIINE